ncbi:MAG: GGDEF domain-containing protein [Kutzneria sp.]|nr:GGDEF domain-containing protein [Kutzneria sp.]MBV9843973.1 GGDEF domain-containing protein [Kutzneria sp.]
MLLAIGAIQAELSRRTERLRRYLASSVNADMTSVWIFAGALELPSPLAVLLTVAIYLHLWGRVWRQQLTRPAHRTVFSASTVILACLAVGPVLGLVDGETPFVDTSPNLRGLAGVCLAILVFTATNSALVMIGLKLRNPDSGLAEVTGGWDNNILELATLCLGGMTAVVLALRPYLLPLIVLPIVMLHRSLLMRQFQEMATRDQKTGVLNSVAWHDTAVKELDRATRQLSSFGVLMIDIDHFKRVNDTHGHLVGDTVLKHVAGTLENTVRKHDSVGRFGGEEFVVLLPATTHTEVVMIAERVRRAITALVVRDHGTAVSGLSASIGVAVYPNCGVLVDRLLVSADNALYVAKQTGRNRVVSLIESGDTG